MIKMWVQFLWNRINDSFHANLHRGYLNKKNRLETAYRESYYACKYPRPGAVSML